MDVLEANDWNEMWGKHLREQQETEEGNVFEKCKEVHFPIQGWGYMEWIYQKQYWGRQHPYNKEKLDKYTLLKLRPCILQKGKYK